MRYRETRLDGPFGWVGTVAVWGHWGRPVLVFPAESGRAYDIADNGLVDAVADLVEGGRAKVYAVDSFDAYSWSDRSVPTEERARRHSAYESWLLERVLPWVADDSGGRLDLVSAGVSLGAYHAANLTLRHGHLAPHALCLSGNYDPATWSGWGERGDATYFHNPFDYVSNLDGEHLGWLQLQVHLVLVVGEGAWEVHPTQSLPSTRAFAELLARKGIPHELDVWGHDTPHDWPSWRRQLAVHLPRFC